MWPPAASVQVLSPCADVPAMGNTSSCSSDRSASSKARHLGSRDTWASGNHYLAVLPAVVSPSAQHRPGAQSIALSMTSKWKLVVMVVPAKSLTESWSGKELQNSRRRGKRRREASGSFSFRLQLIRQKGREKTEGGRSTRWKPPSFVTAPNGTRERTVASPLPN